MWYTILAIPMFQSLVPWPSPSLVLDHLQVDTWAWSLTKDVKLRVWLGTSFLMYLPCVHHNSKALSSKDWCWGPRTRLSYCKQCEGRHWAAAKEPDQSSLLSQMVHSMSLVITTCIHYFTFMPIFMICTAVDCPSLALLPGLAASRF